MNTTEPNYITDDQNVTQDDVSLCQHNRSQIELGLIEHHKFLIYVQSGIHNVHKLNKALRLRQTLFKFIINNLIIRHC